MDTPIISRDTIRARGRQAHAEGKSRDEHNMNWSAAAIAEWQAGWDEDSRETGNKQLEAA
jgi:hypothetical protein